MNKNKLKRFKEDRAGISTTVIAVLVVTILIAVGVAYMFSSSDQSNSNMKLGIIITDVATGESTSGSLNMGPASPTEELFSAFNPSRTMTLPALYTNAELDVFRTSVSNIILNKQYKVTPYIEITTVPNVAGYYSSGAAYATFTAKTSTANGAYPVGDANPDFSLTTPTTSITMNTPTYLNNAGTMVSFVKMQTPSGAIPITGTYMAQMVIHAVVSVTYQTSGGSPESHTATADLTIDLLSPVSAAFSITVNDFGVNAT